MDTWDKIMTKWEYVLPPSRPSQLEIERISNLLQFYSLDSPIAVLGSTIEYRDLLYQLGFQNVYVLEKNLSFYKTLSSWKIYPCENELLIEGDWRETISRYKNYFCCILSDLTMGNVPYCDRDNFYFDIENSLCDDGFFIDKVLTNELPYISMEELYEKYSHCTINIRTVNNFSCEALFCSELLNEQIVDTTKYYRVLQERFSNDLRIQKFIEKAHLITPENCIWYYGLEWDCIKKDYYKYFTKSVHFEDELTSPYFGRMKHIINYK